MAKRDKQLSAKISELARQRSEQTGISYESSQRYFQRIFATGAKQKIVNPTFKGLQKETVKREVSQVKQAIEEKEIKNWDKKYGFEEKEIQRVNFSSNKLLTVKARFNFYGNDNRVRKIRLDLSAEEINNFLNSPDLQTALETLKDTEKGEFLAGAEISELEFFEFDGKTKNQSWFE